jgi:hypothetical protein
MKQVIPSMRRDILLALVIGATIVLLIAGAGNQGIAPDLTRTLLSPGLRLAHATDHSAHDAGAVLIVVVDSIVYGFVSFIVLRVLRTMLH